MTLTKFLAKLLGLWSVLAVIGMLLDRGAALAMLDALFADVPLLFVTGAFTVAVGLALVLGHNRWSGGALPILVTLYGWIALIKGLLFLWLPPPAQAQFYGAMHLSQFFYEYLAISLVPGIYLIYTGFKRA
jgi:hypothetical protein